MTSPPPVPGSHGTPPLSGAAAAAIQQATRASHPPLIPAAVRQALTAEDRKAAAEAVAEGKACRLCSGLHYPSELACPRLASFTLDRDGKLLAGTFWPHGQWPTEDVVFAAEAADEAGEVPG